MKIGLLNDYLNNIKLSFEFEGSSRKLEAVAEGNPFSGETLSISWQVARNSPVELSVKLEKKCFVDCVEIELGEETELQSLALKSDGDTYGVYTAETGKAIYEKVIRLEGGFLSDELSIILLGDFSDIEVRSIRLFGAMEEMQMFSRFPIRLNTAMKSFQ